MNDEGTSKVSRSVYLFQIDSARENRSFFERMHEAIPESVYFRGLDFKTERWTPDGVRVDLEMGTSPRCFLTLIELESNESTALRSSRKYVHESSARICRAFQQYLHRVIEDCDSRADSRGTTIVQLREILDQNILVTVKTAGALRSGTTFLEESLLTDQATSGQLHGNPQYYTSDNGEFGHRQLEFRGILRLNPEQSKSLRRCLSILDAVIRRDDHSGANYHSWRMKTPLKNLLKKLGQRPPTLERFILDQKNSGITVDFEALLTEIVQIWTPNVEPSSKADPEFARNLIADYLPTAGKIKPNDEMSTVFEVARQFLEKTSIKFEL